MKTHRSKLCLLFTVAVVSTSFSSLASILVVTNLASLGPGTLRQALSDNITLGGGNTIVFSNVTGTITLQGELSVLAPVTILGPGTNVLAVSGNNSVRVFTVTAGPTFISDLTIRDGRAVGVPGQGNQEDGQDGLGGGIWNLNSMLTISNCLVLSNSVAGGVGAERRMGIVGRGGKSMGGGICNSGGTLLVLNTRFEGNDSTGGIGGSGLSGAGGSGGEGHGGAIYSTTGTGQIAACTFVNNQVSGGQGGFSGGGQHGAGGPGYGGAIYSISPLTILNSTLNGNAANGGLAGNGVGSGNCYGGGIYSISSLTLNSCTIVSNTALSSSTDFGGGILGGGDTGITNCTIAFNQSDNGGGLQGMATLANTIIARNSATNGPDANGFLFNSQDYNLIENTNGMTLLGAITHLITGQDPLLGPLQNNGGPTHTMALLPNSPAIDQGKNFGIDTDQRGFVRPYNLPSVANAAGGDGSDIGAFESIPTPQLNIQRAADNNVVLSWSGDAADFRLESATNLPSANNWQEVTNTRTYTANLAFVTNTASGAAKFYRLILPANPPVP